MATKDLIVYVIGISGKCSKDYIGCGKSCMCRQFVYSEYTEESYSTLSQAEFDSQVINQQHTIYWGQKEQTYTLSTEMNYVSVNFKVFEHTVFYQDGTNKPFHGHDNYEDRIFSHRHSFLNKYAFRSRKNMLNPEEFGYENFLLSTDLDAPVAYMYVVDVSQSCSVFESQMQLMSRLVKSIQKTHCCVVVASKFDTQCTANVKFLEAFANSINMTVVKCSSKYNANVDTAFECLAVEALSLKNIVAEVQDITQRLTCYHIDKKQHKKVRSASLNDLRHLSTSSLASNALHRNELSCSHNNLNASDKKELNKRSRLSSAFGKILLNRKSAKASKHNITMPTTYLQNKCRSTIGHALLTCEYNHTVSSCPDLSSALSGTVKSKGITDRLASSSDMLCSDYRPAVEGSEIPLLKLGDQINHPKQHSRSAMPLPLTPLDLVISKGSLSSSTSFTSTSTGMKEPPLSPTLSTTIVDSIDMAGNHNNVQKKHGYEEVDYSFLKESSNSGIVVVVNGEVIKINQDNRRTSTSVISDISATSGTFATSDTSATSNTYATSDTSAISDEISSETFLNEELLLTTHETAALGNHAAIGFDEDGDYVINDYEFRQMQQASVAYLTIIHTDTMSSSTNIDSPDHIEIKDEDDDNIYAQIEASTDDKITSECIAHGDGCIANTKQCKVSKPKHLDSDMSSYIFMHKATCSSSSNKSPLYTYDYVDHFYMQMLRRRCSGVPPRNVKRVGYKPSIDISTYSNAIKSHNATYVNCSNINRQLQHGTTLLPPRQLHTNDEKSDAMLIPPPRNIPRPGCYLSAPPATPIANL